MLWFTNAANDSRYTHPEGEVAQGKTAAELFQLAEDDKKRKYGVACQKKGHKFIPFVWTTGGALGQCARKLIEKLAAKLGERWNRPKGRCKAWIQGQIALAIARATSACIRNTRGSLPQEAYDIPSFDGAAIGEGVARL